MSRDRDFLARWSARKQKTRTELEAEPGPEAAPPAPSAAPDGVAPESAAPEGAPQKTDDEILTELGLPDPETLVKGDSIAGFLKAGVPMRLRNRALRRMWLSDPVFANLDGLNDYEEDFTDAATVVKGMKTAYRAGRGFLPDEPTETPASEAETDPEAAEEVAPDPATDAETEVATSAEAPEGEPEPEPEGASASVETDEHGQGDPAEDDRAPADDEDQTVVAEEAEEPLPPLRRMRFRFDSG